MNDVKGNRPEGRLRLRLALLDKLDDEFALSAPESLHAPVVGDTELAHDVIGLGLADARNARQKLMNADAICPLIGDGIREGKFTLLHKTLELGTLTAGLSRPRKCRLALLVGQLG